MEWVFDRATTADFDRAESLEWLETNGLGGWASSTVSGANSRRYHGLLVAATRPPVGRLVLLSRLDETVRVGGAAFELGANRFPGAVHPQGHLSVERFRRGLFPEITYRAGGVVLRKTIACPSGENTTLVLYEVLEAPGPFVLELVPFFAGRDYHALARATDAVAREAAFAGGVLSYRAYGGQPMVHLALEGSAWTPSPAWWHRFQYARERERGLDFEEDLFTPGALSVRLGPGARAGVVVSTDEPKGRDAFALLERERRRREALLRVPAAADPLGRALVLAADQFIVRRGADLRTVIAGYPWFTDWGRDTMIALPGLCLATGRLDDARSILRAFLRAVNQGMLPNRFPDDGEAPEYNTVDATLWLFVALHRYHRASGDDAFVRDEALPALREIVAWHRRGTRHGIRVDEDGLLRAGEPGVQLTWMDARVGDFVVTPRHGKPVEINALWYNALRILAGFEASLGEASAWRGLEDEARRVRARFGEVFWNEAGGCLFDVAEGESRDASLRPNQVLALALPFLPLDVARARRVLRTVEERLLTPVGLRSLAPGEPGYRPVYEGDVASRDGAYHQGTVWSWLLGPYLTVLVRLRGEPGRREARRVLAGFAAHLGEAGVGSVSEIFDAEPPHAPRGCVAQAWSVGEILRAAVEDGAIAETVAVPAGRQSAAPARSRSARRVRRVAPSAASPE